MKKRLNVITKLLKITGVSISTAESCTGGLLSVFLTSAAGSSRYFKGAVVAYDNDAKISLLKVPKKALTCHSAVSKEVALLMARGVKKIFNTDISVGITGIAGPGGGTDKKPAGLVYISAIRGNRKITARFDFKGTRTAIRRKAAYAALDIIGELLE